MRVSGPSFATVEQLHALDERLAAQPDDPGLRFERAQCLDGLGRGEDAMRAYRALLDVDRAHFGALTNLGTLFLEQGMLEGAATCFYAALATAPADPLAHLNAALVNLQAGVDATARAHFDDVLRLFPDDAQAQVHAHHGLARVAERTGDTAAAEHHRRLAFAQPVGWTFSYRGTGRPLRVLEFKSPRGGDLVTNQFFDDGVVERVVLVPESIRAADALPLHHVVFNGIGEPDAARATLEIAAALVATSGQPVINDPRAVLQTDRERMMERLEASGTLVAPRTRRLARDRITADGLAQAGFTFPLMLRSPGFHAGGFFERVERADELANVAAALPGAELYAIAFHDARGNDGWVRKYRVAFIDGRPYPIHLAISSDWKVHYFSSAMADQAHHRAEEQRFLDDMPGVLGEAGMAALGVVNATLHLDYGGVDFGRDRAGRIVVFEANAAMAIYAPADDPRWDYRRGAYAAAVAAFRTMLLDRALKGGYTP